jgi:hypothetical protein
MENFYELTHPYIVCASLFEENFQDITMTNVPEASSRTHQHENRKKSAPL